MKTARFGICGDYPCDTHVIFSVCQEFQDVISDAALQICGTFVPVVCNVGSAENYRRSKEQGVRCELVSAADAITSNAAEVQQKSNALVALSGLT